MKTEYILIFNSLAGSFKREKIDYLINTLKKYNIITVCYDLANYIKAIDLIKNLDTEEIKCLIIAGGDGTITSICNAVLAMPNYQNFIIAIVPMGTANVLAIDLNIRNVNEAIQNIIKANVEKINVGELTEIKTNSKKYFILMVSAGIDSWSIVNLNEKLKKKIGRMAYILSFIGSLKKKFLVPCIVKIKDKKYPSRLVCVSNNKYYGGKFKVAQKDLKDNFFEVLIIKKINLFSITSYLFRVLLKQEASKKNTINLKTDSLTIESELENYPAQVDGDYFCNLPIEIKVSEKKLNFIK